METREVQEKAKAFFALWQEQVALWMRDPSLMESALKSLLAVQGACYTRPTEMMDPGVADAQSSPFPPFYGTIPGAQLAARLAECEARIAELESALAAGSRMPHQNAASTAASRAA